MPTLIIYYRGVCWHSTGHHKCTIRSDGLCTDTMNVRVQDSWMLKCYMHYILDNSCLALLIWQMAHTHVHMVRNDKPTCASPCQELRHRTYCPFQSH